MQSVKFKSLNEFLDFLPEDELIITEFLRELIFECTNEVKEKLSFNVPYYMGNKGLFFIWPASVLWGKKKTYEGVRFGFQQGNLMSDELNYLDKGNRKLIYWRDYTSIEEIDVDILKAYIFEALEIDKQFAQNRPKKPKKRT